MSNDLKRGCFVYRINRFLECYCDSPNIPSTLKVSLLSPLLSPLLSLPLLLSSSLLSMLSSSLFIKVDLTGKAKGDVIRINSIIMPQGITPTEKVNVNSFVLAKIESGRSK